MILTINTTTNTAWKVNHPFLLEEFCSKEDAKLCFENLSYSLSEIVLKTSHKVKTESFFVSGLTGRVHTIYPPEGVIRTFHKKSFTVSLNKNFRYKLVISDPQFTIFTPNPITFPRTMLEVEPFSGRSLIYLEVSRIIKYCNWRLIPFYSR